MRYTYCATNCILQYSGVPNKLRKRHNLLAFGDLQCLPSTNRDTTGGLAMQMPRSKFDTCIAAG